MGRLQIQKKPIFTFLFLTNVSLKILYLLKFFLIVHKLIEPVLGLSFDMDGRDKMTRFQFRDCQTQLLVRLSQGNTGSLGG